MDKFGTVRVPDTYIFNSEGKNLVKFMGPQDWKHPNFDQRINFLLSKNPIVKQHKIESH